jgi:hypothetical protein
VNCANKNIQYVKEGKISVNINEQMKRAVAASDISPFEAFVSPKTEN